MAAVAKLALELVFRGPRVLNALLEVSTWYGFESRQVSFYNACLCVLECREESAGDYEVAV